jgi:hypothetical protein
VIRPDTLTLNETVAVVDVVVPEGAEVIATEGLVLDQRTRTIARRRPEPRSRATRAFRLCVGVTVTLLNETR